MAKNVNHIQHVRSSALQENLPKLPNASALLEGELAVNYAADKEVLATKNSSGEVVTFSSDNYYTEKKLGELFSGDTTVSEVILDNEQVIAAALNDLDSRKLDKVDYQPTDLSNYYTKSETYSKTEVDNLIPDVDGYFDGAEYNSNDKKIYFKHGNDVISAATIDATAFIKDGMVSSAYTSAVTDSETSAVTNYLMIEFNTDASGETIAINLDEIIDPDNYYTKAQIDDAELVVSSALNDLESRKLDASAYTPTDLSDYYTKNEIDEISSGHLTTAKFEEKLGSGFTGENSANTITSVIEHNELVTSAALNDLNTKVGSGFSNSSITEVVSTTVLGLNTLFDTYVSKQEFENKIGSSFTGSNSATTITKYLDDKELVISSALNDLNAKKLDASAYTPTDLSDYYTKGEIDDIVGSGFSESSITDVLNDVIEGIDESDLVVSAALNDLNSRKMDASAYTPTDLSNYYTKAQVDGLIPSVDGYFDGVSYDSDSHIITFSHGGSSAATLDATAFIKDGMVSSAYTSAVTDSETSAVTNYLYIVFNTDANKETIAINLGEIIDPDNYYTKEEIDDAELVISSALNDLESRKLDASALTEAVSDFVTSEDLEDYATNDSLSAYVLTTKFEEKLGSGFTGENSGNTITKVIIDNELVVSAALNDLNSRKLDASAFTQSMGDYYTTAQTDTLLSSKADTATTYTKTEVNDLIPSVDAYFDGAVYDSSTKRINFKHGDTVKSYIDATDFIKDGMVSGVTLNGNNLVITFNTDAGAQDITVDLSTLIPTVDTALDSGSTNPLQNKAVYDAYVSATTYDNFFSYSASSASTNAVQASALTAYLDEKEYVIARSLTELDSRLQGVAYSADVNTLVNDVANTMQSMLIELSGAVEDLQESQITVDSVFDEEHSSGSSNPVAASALFDYINEIDLGTASALNDLNTRLGGKQDTLVSGTNIKTINGYSILGEGNLTIEDGGGGGSSLPNASVLSAITSSQVSGWDSASAQKHTHSNKSVIDGITAQKVTNWDTAYTSAHTHANKGVLDNLTQTVIDNSHTHDNKTVLDDITTAKTVQWDTVTAKTDTTAFTAHTADTTAHVTSAEKTAWNGKVSAITMNGSSVTVTNGTANLGTVLTSFTETDPTVPSWAKQSTKPTYTASEVGALPTGTTLDDIADGTTRKLSDYSLTSHTHSEYATTATVNTLSGTVTAHTADSTVHVTSAEKSTWNGKQDALSNASVLEGITSTKVSNWDGAATNSHTHANKGVLDNLTQSVIDNSHSHSNSTVLNNLTQTVIDNSHSHTNKTVLDGITTAKTQQWDNAISAVSFNGTDATITNHKAAITATIPTVNDATITLTFGNSSSAFTVNQGSNLTINLATLIGIPAPTASDNGKILGVVNGAFAWITPTTIYTGTGTPSSSQGNDGDIYLQTS